MQMVNAHVESRETLSAKCKAATDETRRGHHRPIDPEHGWYTESGAYSAENHGPEHAYGVGRREPDSQSTPGASRRRAVEHEHHRNRRSRAHAEPEDESRNRERGD